LIPPDTVDMTIQGIPPNVPCPPNGAKNVDFCKNGCDLSHHRSNQGAARRTSDPVSAICWFLAAVFGRKNGVEAPEAIPAELRSSLPINATCNGKFGHEGEAQYWALS
jgi:hypothetical protein